MRKEKRVQRILLQIVTIHILSDLDENDTVWEERREWNEVA